MVCVKWFVKNKIYKKKIYQYEFEFNMFVQGINDYGVLCDNRIEQ